MTSIPYCTETWEPIGGCTHCAPGCIHCWSEDLVATRFQGKKRYDGLTENGRWTGRIKLFHDRLEEPLHYRDPKRIFVCSQADLFHPKVPFEILHQIYRTIYSCPQHTFLLFTKRIERAMAYYDRNPYTTDINAFPNLQLFVSISTQAEADEKIPVLLQIPAAVRGVSLEPLLEDIDLTDVDGNDVVSPKNDKFWDGANLRPAHLDQVIIGAESIRRKPGRPCELEWVRNIVGQCKSAGVAVYVKQLILNGELVRDMKRFPKDLQVRQLV